MIELHNLCDKGRHRELVYKRNYIYSELYKLNINLTQIGRMLDKDHVTVMHGLKVDKQFQNFDKIYNDIIAPIKDYLYPGEAPNWTLTFFQENFPFTTVANSKSSGTDPSGAFS